METLVLQIEAAQPDPTVLGRAARVIQAGGLVAFPTETVYGLGANALDERAVRAIFAAKGRPARNPLIVHVADLAMIGRVVADWPETAHRLAERFWPGPLTIILPRLPEIPDAVSGGGSTVAIRMPAHPVAHGLITAAGVPLAAPSANRSTELSPTTAEHVLRGLDGRIDLLLDGGPAWRGIESTVVDLTTQPPRLLRPGPIPARVIEEVTGPLDRQVPETSTGPLPAPGMLERHYAPRTPLELCATREELEARARVIERGGAKAGRLLIGTGSSGILMPNDPDAYAARLFAELHRLDQAGCERILVELPPDTDDWLAIHDRLRRAGTREEAQS